MKVIRVFLADDHGVLREGLRALLAAHPGVKVVGEAADGPGAVDGAASLRPDVVVMDVAMPGLNGAKATERLKKACPAVKVLALSAHEDKAYLRQLLEAGASGYVLKRAAAGDLVQAIRAVAGGGVYLDPSKQFMTRARAACRETGTLFVADEVTTGFGRTGKLFASEYFDLDPDVLCLVKAITAGCTPMGAAVMTAGVAEAAGVGFYSTCGWHPLAVAAVAANPRYWGKHSDRILTNVADQGDYFRARLDGMKFAEPASVEVMGLAIGVEFGDGSDYASKLGDRCPEAGLLVSAEEDNLLTMFPELTSDREVARQGLDLLEGCF